MRKAIIEVSEDVKKSSVTYMSSSFIVALDCCEEVDILRHYINVIYKDETYFKKYIKITGYNRFKNTWEGKEFRYEVKFMSSEEWEKEVLNESKTYINPYMKPKHIF